MSLDFDNQLVGLLRDLRAFARTFHSDPARADDLVHETVVRALANRTSFRPGTNMRAWLFTILRNAYYSELRRTRREVEDPEGTMAETLVSAPTQESHMAMRDVGAALSHMSPEHREVLVLIGASGFTYEETAEITGVSTGTVKSRLNRARRRLAELLGETEESPFPQEALRVAASAVGP